MYASMLFLQSAAFAGTPIDLPSPSELTGSRAGDSGVKTRPYTQEVNIRGGWANVPASILDIWYFDGEDNGGTHQERPKAHAYSIGLEYVIRTDEANGIFYFEYMPALMDAGYWDDREDPPDYQDGDYVSPDHLAVFNLGGNYGFEVKIQDWFSLIFGGGLGISIRRGEINKWDSKIVTDENGQRQTLLPWDNYEQNKDTPDSTYDIPKVLPLIDIQAGMRFTISEQANIRIYGGLHNLIFIGASTGVVF
jgi:hypothetical protein